MNLLQRLKFFLLRIFNRPKYPEFPGLTRVPDTDPPIYTDEHGQTYSLFGRPPNYQDADQADDGQHDVWKKEMRIVLWRSIYGPATPGAVDLAALGLGRRHEPVPVLFPVGEQLAQVSRRLGYMNLARAAMPEASEEQLHDVYLRNEAAVRVEAALRSERNAVTAQSWDAARMGAPFMPDAPESVVAALTLGSLHGPLEAVELKPLRLRTTSENFKTFTKPKR